LEHLDVKGKVVVIRVDYNVPMKEVASALCMSKIKHHSCLFTCVDSYRRTLRPRPWL